MPDYTDTEFMICISSRLIPDASTVFIGYGMPQIAAILAQKLYAPRMCQVYEFGAIAPLVATPFVRFAMADSRNSYRAVSWKTMNPVMGMCANGLIDYGFLGAAQIDPYGNINSTLIGEYEKPKRRFPGSGGGNAVASFCWRTVIVMEHERRRFVKKLDFLTSPGYLDGPGAREKIGLPKGTGPYRVVTSKALFDFDEGKKLLRLISISPATTVDDVLEEMQFEPLIKEKVEILKEPTEDELRLLREEIDPGRVIIGR
jgi:glutaconate CoA-transferase subunit B